MTVRPGIRAIEALPGRRSAVLPKDKAAGTAAVRKPPLPAPVSPASRWPCPPSYKGNMDNQDGQDKAEK